MPRALILNTAFKSSLTGGTFADTLAAATGDSLTVANFDTGTAKVAEAWVIDSASVGEISIVYTRPQSTHDQNRGLRASIAALVPGGAGNVGAHQVLPGYGYIDVYKSDTLTLTVSGTAADAVVFSWQTLYDDLPGVSSVMASWDQIQALQVSAVGVCVCAGGCGL